MGEDRRNLTPEVTRIGAALEPRTQAREALRRELRAASVWLVIPAYKVSRHILGVLASVPSWVTGVVVVDDACPEHSGDVAEGGARDPRVIVVRHEKNRGVGGAVLTGYAAAIQRSGGVLVKVDGDGQMDLKRLTALVLPIIRGQADFTKGNRFASHAHWGAMPPLRIVGNAGLSLMAKISTGYWNLFDPTNGFTAVDAQVARAVLSKKIAQRFFFESDMLYHLGTLRAVGKDVPMPSHYGEEVSNLNPLAVAPRFFWGHLSNTFKRFIGQYIVRDFSVATLEFLAGLALVSWGVGFGLVFLATKSAPDVPASPGVVMAVALPIIIGMQLFLSALSFDVMNVPKEPIAPGLRQLDDID